MSSASPAPRPAAGGDSGFRAFHARLGNEIPVRLLDFYDIFISWTERAATGPSDKQAAHNGRNDMIPAWHRTALAGVALALSAGAGLGAAQAAERLTLYCSPQIEWCQLMVEAFT